MQFDLEMPEVLIRRYKLKRETIKISGKPDIVYKSLMHKFKTIDFVMNENIDLTLSRDEQAMWREITLLSDLRKKIFCNENFVYHRVQKRGRLKAVLVIRKADYINSDINQSFFVSIFLLMLLGIFCGIALTTSLIMMFHMTSMTSHMNLDESSLLPFLLIMAS